MTNLNLKKVLEDEDEDFLTKSFTIWDEAFAVMLLLNYEERWKNQVKFPTDKREELNKDPLYKTKFMSSNKGYSKCSWSEEGIALYKEWYGKIARLRACASTGKLLEGRVLETLKEAKKGGKNRNKNKTSIVQNLPIVGGALQAKLVALVATNAVSV